MTTTAVIKHFNVFEQIGLRAPTRVVAHGGNAFVFQAVEEAFRRCIVSAISFATTHRAAHAVSGQLALEFVTRVLGALLSE